MQLLAAHRTIFTWLRIFPFANDTDRNILRRSGAFSVTVLLSEIIALTTSILYTYKCENAQNFFNCSSYAINQISGFGSTLYTLIVAYIMRHKIRNMFDKIQGIYDGMYILSQCPIQCYNSCLNLNQHRRRKWKDFWRK